MPTNDVLDGRCDDRRSARWEVHRAGVELVIVCGLLTALGARVAAWDIMHPCSEVFNDLPRLCTERTSGVLVLSKKNDLFV